MNYTEFT